MKKKNTVIIALLHQLLQFYPHGFSQLLYGSTVIAQLVECRTLDPRVAGLNITKAWCLVLEQDT